MMSDIFSDTSLHELSYIFHVRIVLHEFDLRLVTLLEIVRGRYTGLS